MPTEIKPNDPAPATSDPAPAPIPAAVPDPAPVLKEEVEPHKVDDPLKAVMDLITANHTETLKRFAILEQRTPAAQEEGKTNDTPEGKQEQAAPESARQSESGRSTGKPKRFRVHLFRTF